MNDTELIVMKEDEGIAMKCYKVERWCYLHHLFFIAKIVFRLMQIFLGCTVPYTCDLEDGVIIAHFHGVVMNEKCHIGRGSKIYQNVTIGGINGEHGAYIGRNCIIGSGAVLLGEIKVGDNVRIGANAVVLKDLPDNCTAVGVPAKIVKQNNNCI